MYEALGVIEPAIARAAVHNASPADIISMEALLNLATDAIPDDVPGHLAACREFQARPGACARSPFLTRMLLSIEERSDMFLIHSGQALPPEKMQASINDHREILNAVRSFGQSELAAEAAHAHSQAIRVRWREMYPQHLIQKS